MSGTRSTFELLLLKVVYDKPVFNIAYNFNLRPYDMVYSNSLVWLPLGSELPPDEEVKFSSFTQSQTDYLKQMNAEAGPPYTT